MNETITKLSRAGLSAVAAGALLAGCGRPAEPEVSEAERFGYKGEDLVDNTNLTYLVVSPTVTNWVPERVLMVCEDYEFTPDELAVLEAAGTLTPSVSYKAFPKGYELETKEPWFEVWRRPSEQFGLKGVVGVMAHYNEDKELFETSETYFSSYWNNRAEALVALDKIERELAAKYHVLKFHKFDGCWVAEYVRLCVMGVVGQKADGTWTCMFDLRDKRNAGCDVWEPVRDQQERRNYYEYSKAMRKWREDMARLVAANRTAIAAACEERGLAGFPESGRAFDYGDGRTARTAGGSLPALKDGEDLETALQAAWRERAAAAEKAIGVAFGEPSRISDDCGVRLTGEATSDLYKATLNVEMFPPPPAREPPAAEPGDGDGPGEPIPEEDLMPYCANNWRIVYEERLQEGIVLPTRPQLKKLEED